MIVCFERLFPLFSPLGQRKLVLELLTLLCQRCLKKVFALGQLGDNCCNGIAICLSLLALDKALLAPVGQISFFGFGHVVLTMSFHEVVLCCQLLVLETFERGGGNIGNVGDLGLTTLHLKLSLCVEVDPSIFILFPLSCKVFSLAFGKGEFTLQL